MGPSVRKSPLRLHDAHAEVAEEERRAVKPEVLPFRRHPPLNLRQRPRQPRLHPLLNQRQLEAPLAEEVEEEEEEEEAEEEEEEERRMPPLRPQLRSTSSTTRAPIGVMDRQAPPNAALT